ncbi:MAG: tetratricopeptide repeat protein [Aliishimia sp.]
MGTKHSFHHLIVTAAIVMVGYSLPLHAQDRAESLLESLQTASPEEASRIDRTLRSEWSKSGSASMDLLLRRGRKALDEDNLDAAIEHFTALTDHAPDFAEGWHGLARAYFQADLYGPTLDALGHVMVLNPDHYNAIFGLGALFQQFGDFVRAENAYRQVLALNPHHEEAIEAIEQLKRQGIGRTL